MIKVHAHLKWAEQLINRAVELMPLEQLGQWEGVRTWQEYNPVDELTENLQENWQQIYTEHAAQQKLLREVWNGLQYVQENIEEIQERVANLRGFIRVTLDYSVQGGNTHPLWEIMEQTRRLREHLERIQVQTSDLLESKDLD